MTATNQGRLRVFEKTFDPGAIICNEGDDNGELYVLLEGSVEVIKGGQVIARENRRGIYLGEMSLLLGNPRCATLRADAECRFYVVPQERVYQFFNRSPEMALNLARGLARRLTNMNIRCRQLENHESPSQEE